jgi:hypothetical protein
MKALKIYLQELNELITFEYEQIQTHAAALMKTINYVDKATIDWELVHLKTALVEVHKTIKNFEDRLKTIDANKSVQE